MNIAIVGCGYVADYYIATLRFHPELKLLGVMDRDAERAALFSRLQKVPAYPTLDAVLGDPKVEMVLNLTNPGAHYEISKVALLAGKHVYSEKPLAMQMDQATELVELAEARNLQLASAPCSLLGETAQTLWKLLREGTMGTVRDVYAEMDDGMVHRMPYRDWVSASGLPWPYKDEFEVGCTMEHAGYCLAWLAAWFGPALSVTSFASLQVPEKALGVRLDAGSPDFSVACIQFASGVVARVTCSIVAPHDHSLRIVTDNGVLSTRDFWDYRSPVYTQRMIKLRSRVLLNPLRRRHKLLRLTTTKALRTGPATMDFVRGPAEVAAAIREQRPCRLSARFSLHINELVLAIHNSGQHSGTRRMTTTFDPIEPMPSIK